MPLNIIAKNLKHEKLSKKLTINTIEEFSYIKHKQNNLIFNFSKFHTPTILLMIDTTDLHNVWSFLRLKQKLFTISER